MVSDVSNFADIDAVVDAIRAHGNGLDVVFTSGADRMLGYGLKYERGFGFTHLGYIGGAKQG